MEAFRAVFSVDFAAGPNVRIFAARRQEDERSLGISVVGTVRRWSGAA